MRQSYYSVPARLAGRKLGVRLGVMPTRCVDALRLHRQRHPDHCKPTDLVFATRNGTTMDSHNVRRDLRKVVAAAGLNPKDWTPREMRHSFVSILSDAGIPIEQISRLVGHSGTNVTETVYRHQIRPVT